MNKIKQFRIWLSCKILPKDTSILQSLKMEGKVVVEVEGTVIILGNTYIENLARTKKSIVTIGGRE